MDNKKNNKTRKSWKTKFVNVLELSDPIQSSIEFVIETGQQYFDVGIRRVSCPFFRGDLCVSHTSFYHLKEFFLTKEQTPNKDVSCYVTVTGMYGCSLCTQK